MSAAQELAQRYIASWNETNAANRRGMVSDLWTEDARYADPMMTASGHDGIAALIGGVHGRFPGYRFAVSGQADGHGQFVRFSWSLSPQDGQVVARGTDFATLADDGRLAQVTGFLDQVPNAA